MSADDHNPLSPQMSDESMVRSLAAQAAAVWPQESELLRAYDLADDTRAIDVGCGTGEFALRFGRLLPQSTVVGVDLVESSLAIARKKCAELGSRVRFEVGDALSLSAEDDAYDLSVSRHMLQAVPDAPRVLAEMVRVTRPGGRLHVLAEDYAMIHFHPVPDDVDRFWHDGPLRFGAARGIDLAVGRKVFTLLRQLDVSDLSVRYIVVDTVRVPRDVLIRTWEAWRDGFTDVIAENSQLSREQVVRAWETMLACLRDPDAYAVWQVPVISGVPR